MTGGRILIWSVMLPTHIILHDNLRHAWEFITRCIEYNVGCNHNSAILSNGIMAWKYGHSEILEHDCERDHSVPEDERNNYHQQTVRNLQVKDDIY
jgi:hypothetical protein